MNIGTQHIFREQLPWLNSNVDVNYLKPRLKIQQKVKNIILGGSYFWYVCK